MNGKKRTLIRESAQVNTVAEKAYLDGLTNNYIDIDAFHAAYDDIITEASPALMDLFYKRGERILRHRGTYGNIKDLKGYNTPVYNALVSLWLAQFKNDLPVQRGSAPLTHKGELVAKSFEIVNRAKNLNYKVSNITEDDIGRINCYVVSPSGKACSGGFETCWFDDTWTNPTLPVKIKEQLEQVTGDERIMRQIIAYLGMVRDEK